jgi:hypothetical protein
MMTLPPENCDAKLQSKIEICNFFRKFFQKTFQKILHAGPSPGGGNFRDYANRSWEKSAIFAGCLQICSAI